jgi:primosomal protein N' (replication factor Y)
VVEVSRVLKLPKARPLTALALQISEDLDEMPLEALETRAPKQAAILKDLREAGDAVRQSEVLRRTGSSTSPVKGLVEKGFAEKTRVQVRRDPFKVEGLVRSEPRNPSREQADAITMIRDGLEAESPQTTLLYGVTGSGKTEVYLQSIATVLEQGRSCINLVPEISLTTHLLEAYKSRFGDQVAVLHSRLSVGERHDEWRRIESGEARIVLGARSAVFAPVNRLGLVVVDEEHESSYKQEHSPRYNARAAAEERARDAEACVVLGSATPSIESFQRGSSGEINFAVLSHRIDDRPMPVVTLVDQRDEYEAGRRSIFSSRLREKITEKLSRKEQIILFVNRRGYASFILCRSCGHTPRCPHCDVSLTYHAANRMLRCHHCGEEERAPTVCPQCEGIHIQQFGLGTERVEEEVRKVFPQANVIRMDSDTTTRKNAYREMLGAFRDGKADVLVGTQMIAKGLDFHNVTLVGIVSADTMLHIPDFRSSERTFQLLTQVSGRAGRGDLPGEVVVQSFSPEHYAVRAAVRQDYLGFYGQEIVYRRELGYPPFSRLLNVIASDPIEEGARERVERLADLLRDAVPGGVDVIGPAPAPLARLRGLYRWHLVVRSRGVPEIQAVVSNVIGESGLGGAGLSLDVDPMSML